MRILIVARPFVFHGGVETATAGLVQALVARGHEVHRTGPGRQAPQRGVVDHPLPLGRWPRAARALALVLAVRRVAGQGGWDVIQSHERTLSQDVYRAGEGCHRAYLQAMQQRPRGLYHRVTLALERQVFRRTPQIVAIARAGAAEIARLYGVEAGRLSVVYNGVDLERFHPRLRGRERAAARAEAGLPANAFAVLFAGSGFERKGLAVALRALGRLRDGNSCLLVVGRDDPAPCRRLARDVGVVDRVRWLGARPDIERWYAAADALVLPTRYEPFGNVHLEALATGLPVVTSVVAGGAEVIGPGAGAAVEPSSPAAVADALQAVREGKSEEASAAARAAAEPFTFARQVAALEGVYARLGVRNR